MMLTLPVVPLFLCFVSLAITQSNSSLPTVDLGYEIHRAFLYNVSLTTDLFLYPKASVMFGPLCMSNTVRFKAESDQFVPV